MAKATKPKGLSGLMGAAAKKTSAAKSGTPSVQVSDELVPVVSELVEASRELKLAETRKKDAAAKLSDFAESHRVSLSRARNAVLSSIALTTPDGQKVTWVASKWQQMKCEDGAEELLQSIFGENYDKYFSVAPQITISDEISEEEASKLTALLQKNDLMHLITVNPVVKPTDSFKADSVLDPTTAALADRARNEEGLCKQTAYFKA